MRLLTFAAKKKGAPARVGVMSGPEHLVEVKFDDMLCLISSGRAGLLKVKSALKKGKNIPLSSVRILAPIPRPRKNVFCVGWN